jgi:hypothetical protein
MRVKKELRPQPLRGRFSLILSSLRLKLYSMIGLLAIGLLAALHRFRISFPLCHPLLPGNWVDLVSFSYFSK